MSRPIQAVISSAALAHNLACVRHLAPAAKVWAVVKADAYGHGLAAAVQGLQAADGLALIEFDQAQRLRALGWMGPILMLEGAFDRGDVGLAVELGLSLVVHEARQLAWLSEIGCGSLDVWLKLNTGMNRLGVSPEETVGLYQRLSDMPAVSRIGLMSHFADADRDGCVEAPMRRFDAATAALPGDRSLANSAAICASVPTHRDWVRPGVMLYGASPFADRTARSLGLRAAMTLRSELIAVQSLKAGDAVGYGSSFVAPNSMRIGVIACGYADGYPRHAPSGTPVAVDGVITRIVGRVSMDMITIDLGSVPSAGPGSIVELWGETVAIDEVARHAGTIGYELMCAVAPRVLKRVVDF